MKALIFQAPHQAVVTEIEDPRIGPDEGEASRLVVFFSRFEQETVIAASV